MSKNKKKKTVGMSTPVKISEVDDACACLYKIFIALRFLLCKKLVKREEEAFHWRKIWIPASACIERQGL